MFVFAILGIDPVQNLAKYKTLLCAVLIQRTDRRICDYLIHA